MANKLIELPEVAELFGLRTRTMRDYKRLGIIDPVKRVKGKDLYDQIEAKRAAQLADEESLKTLPEIADIVKRDRAKMRKLS